MEEEEVVEEVEAVRAVYGDDCLVTWVFPPHINVRLRPRTADDSSQQFVEIVLGIEASAQYPTDPPCIHILDSKGLDKKREEHLMTNIITKSQELLSYSMLLALCEEAVEILSNMNFPEGDCPLCLYPLFSDGNQKLTLPFMKLMSCFHCFHSQCVSRWWNWLQEHNACIEDKGFEDQQLGNCPVCRKPFDSKDFEHVGGLVEANSTPLSHEELDSDDKKEFLESDMETSRRLKFEALLEKQKKINGLIEPKKPVAVSPGMFLPSSQVPPMDVEMPVNSGQDLASDAATVTAAGISSQKETAGKRNHSNHGRNQNRNPRRGGGIQQANKRWIRKEESSSYK